MICWQLPQFRVVQNFAMEAWVRAMQYPRIAIFMLRTWNIQMELIWSEKFCSYKAWNRNGNSNFKSYILRQYNQSAKPNTIRNETPVSTFFLENKICT